MKRSLLKEISILFSLFFFFTLNTFAVETEAQAKEPGFNLRINVVEKGNSVPVFMASCVLHPVELMAATNSQGQVTLLNVPRGNYMLEVSYLGFETYRTRIRVDKDLNFRVVLQESNLSLKDVVVTAQQSQAGASTASKIGRRAIDHLQATSLADIMQLLPGQRMGNVDLTQQQNLKIRSLTNNNTSAFGSSVVVDGMPMSNNGVVSQGQFNSAAFVGTDLRQISADDIDRVEVVRGIPSAEYGDLTSGLVLVQSKVGVTPLQVKGKIDPALQNYSVGKGFRLKNFGILNINADYAKAWSDPRMKTRSYDRYSINVGYGYSITKEWNTNTKIRFMNMTDDNGKDPDAIQDGTFSKNRNTTFSLTHNGKININRFFIRSLNYTLGFSLTDQKNQQSSFVSSSAGSVHVLTARETGYFAVPLIPQSYLAQGITQSKPFNFFSKINEQFFVHTKKTHQIFKLGLEYKYDHNSGRGYYNLNDSLPLRPNSNGRPRAFSSIPGVHQLSAFAEDNFSWNINKINRLKAQVGVRFTSLQPFSNIALTSLSPRVNVSFDATRWLTLRAGVGLNSKTPGLDYLYPDKKYDDRVAANYNSVLQPETNILYYHTQVYEVAKSYNIKNATTTKYELGIDFNLKGNRRLSIIGYYDKTPRGFGALTNYFTYTSNFYNATNGLIITPGQPTQIDFNNPARTDLIFSTRGEIGNTNSMVNKGVELDFDLGEIKPINTSFFFSGAYSESKSWNNEPLSSSVRTALLPIEYTSVGTTPFKVVYPGAIDYTQYKRFINTLRIVTTIPTLKMVASLATQVVWYDYNLSYVGNKQAQGWIDTNLNEHSITNDMRNGFIGFDGAYYGTQPTNGGVAIADLTTRESDQRPTKQPITWNMSVRITKELGKSAGLSLYVNNAMYYEPYLRSNKTKTLSQRNTGTFNYGVELFFNL